MLMVFSGSSIPIIIISKIKMTANIMCLTVHRECTMFIHCTNRKHSSTTIDIYIDY